MERARAGNPNWKPGISGNPAGRPRTDGHKVQRVRQEALVAMSEFVADKEPRSAVQILQDFANDPKIPTSLRISAACAAAPYETPKLLAVPGPVFLYSKIAVPEFATIEEAELFLLNISQREAAGELETASVQTVSDRVRAWIASKRNGQELELKKLTAGHETGEQVIRIEGGLPQLPGTKVTMPQLNGNGHDAHGLLPPQPSQTPQLIDASPVPGPEAADPTASAGAPPPANESTAGQQCAYAALALQNQPTNPPGQNDPTQPPKPVSAFSGEPAQGPEP